MEDVRVLGGVVNHEAKSYEKVEIGFPFICCNLSKLVERCWRKLLAISVITI